MIPDERGLAMKDILVERLPSIVLIILILLPNMLFFMLPPRNVPDGKLPATFKWSVLQVLENAGRLGVFIIPLFHTVRMEKLYDRISLGGLILSLSCYYALYARYFLKKRDFRFLFSPLAFIPVPLAIFPLMCFVFSSILMRSIPLLLATLVLAAGHISISYYDYLRSKPLE
jgi:hypothetical protein